MPSTPKIANTPNPINLDHDVAVQFQRGFDLQGTSGDKKAPAGTLDMLPYQAESRVDVIVSLIAPDRPVPYGPHGYVASS